MNAIWINGSLRWSEIRTHMIKNISVFELIIICLCKLWTNYRKCQRKILVGGANLFSDPNVAFYCADGTQFYLQCFFFLEFISDISVVFHILYIGDIFICNTHTVPFLCSFEIDFKTSREPFLLSFVCHLFSWEKWKIWQFFP